MSDGEDAVTTKEPKDPSRFHRGFGRGAFRGPRAAAYCDVSASKWARMNAAALIPRPVRIHGTVLWIRAELDQWLAAGMPPREEWEATQEGRPVIQSTQPAAEGTMAHLERPTIVRYVDTNGKSVPKGTPGATKVLAKSKKWYGVFRNVLGKRRRKPLAKNKDAARAMLTEIVRKIELEKAGVVDRFQEHRKASVESHILDFEKSLRFKGTSEDQISQVAARVRRVMKEAKFVLLGDISPARAANAITEMKPIGRSGSMSVQTRNHYLAAINQFGLWLDDDKRLPENPFGHLQGGNAELDVRHGRQSLTADQLGKILNSAKTSTVVYRGLNGNDRYHVYLTAIYTGFRRTEVASLSPADFDFVSDPVTVSLPMAITKNRKGATQPIPRAIADELDAYLPRPSA